MIYIGFLFFLFIGVALGFSMGKTAKENEIDRLRFDQMQWQRSQLNK